MPEHRPPYSGSGRKPHLAEAVRDLYQEGQTDYSLQPIVAVDMQGQPIGRIGENDGVIFCCRRGEREIQLTEAFVEPGAWHFPRREFRSLTFVILTLYHEKFNHLPVAFAPTHIGDTLGEAVSRAGRRQLRVAESEKFSHVTFFLNGGDHRPFPAEDDVRIPSPKGIPFDQVPGLSLAQVSEQVVRGIEQGFDLIVTNFANGDVIGHTANRPAKIECAGVVDRHLGQVLKAAAEAGYVALVTADHGNLEEMVNPDGTDHVAHTANPVPLIVVDPQAQAPIEVRPGLLADIAPTVLHAMGIPRPEAMTGESLVPDCDWDSPRRVLLVILDGWGMGRADAANPIFLAATPVWDHLKSRFPCTQLQASGEAVGLQPGKPGNSEAGHINIGAGRIVLQDDVRLDLAMQDGSFSTNEVLCRTIREVKQRGASLHLIGLLTEKSSHGSVEYPLALLRMAKANGLEKVFLHMIFDGRSTAPGSAPALLEKLEQQLEAIGAGQVVTGIGRGLALDRDGNYARTRQAYDALVFGVAKKYAAGAAACSAEDAAGAAADAAAGGAAA
jgi:2,3-bisphosphoglycerate-independent phosphoglycerate mutase